LSLSLRAEGLHQNKVFAHSTCFLYSHLAYTKEEMAENLERRLDIAGQHEYLYRVDDGIVVIQVFGHYSDVIEQAKDYAKRHHNFGMTRVLDGLLPLPPVVSLDLCDAEYAIEGRIGPLNRNLGVQEEKPFELPRLISHYFERPTPSLDMSPASIACDNQLSLNFV